MIGNKHSEFFLLLLFIIYIVFNIKTPPALAPYVDSWGGYAIVFGLYLLLASSTSMWYVNAFGAIALFMFVQRSMSVMNDHSSEDHKLAYMTDLNENSHDQTHTLEEEIVHKMAPFQGFIDTTPTYAPVFDSGLTYKGITHL